jgi:cell division inhibitor SulA
MPQLPAPDDNPEPEECIPMGATRTSDAAVAVTRLRQELEREKSARLQLAAKVGGLTSANQRLSAAVLALRAKMLDKAADAADKSG